MVDVAPGVLAGLFGVDVAPGVLAGLPFVSLLLGHRATSIKRPVVILISIDLAGCRPFQLLILLPPLIVLLLPMDLPLLTIWRVYFRLLRAPTTAPLRLLLGLPLPSRPRPLLLSDHRIVKLEESG